MNKLKPLLLLFVPILSLGIILLNNIKLFNDEEQKPSSKKEEIRNSYGNIPMSFEENRGQTDSKVKFLSRGRGYNLFLTPAEAFFMLTNSDSQTTRVLEMKLANASEPNLVGTNELLGKTNYLIGNNQSDWKTNISTFAKVKYQGVYPGIDLVFYGNQQQLEYDFVVFPGADPKLIKLGFNGLDSRVNTNGDLVLGLGGQEIQFQKPYVYQEDEGVRKTISGGYDLENDRLIGFKIGHYDETKPLFIDPVLVYSTYLGGSGGDGAGDIAVDSSGNAYLTGNTNSINFPTTSGIFQNTLVGANDTFVTKLNPTGTEIIYSTYIGGSNNDIGDRIAIDNGGNAYIVGHTDSTNFPTFNALQPTYGGAALDDFLTKLNPSGTSLVFSTYIGGNGNDGDVNLVLDNTGNIYVSGNTTSTNLPTTSGVVQSAYGGGSEDIYIAKLNPSGSSFIYLTYLGGGNVDQSINIAVGGSGEVYVTGTSFSSNFPVTSGAFQTTKNGDRDAIVAKLNSTATTLIYSTYLGGSSSESGGSIAIDSTGNAYVTGVTQADFPTTSGAFQTDQGSEDAFVTKLNPNGSALIYSTYLGGNSDDRGTDITIDSSGNAYVVGFTNSAAFFPTTPDAIQSVFGGIRDAFLTKLNSIGSALVYSSYLGGSNQEFSGGMALVNGSAYVTGATFSADFPVTLGVFQMSYGGGSSDGFIAKINLNQPPVANAGADQTVVVKNLVTLNGSASFDPDFDPLTYQWGEGATNPQLGVLSSTTAVNPTFTPQVAGAYTFTLVVNDGFEDSASDNVTITVQTPTQAIQSLIDTVESFNLQQGIENSLDAKLAATQQALEDINQNNNQAAINSLNAFISAVEAQRGNQITNEQADILIAAAQAIINSLSS